MGNHSTYIDWSDPMDFSQSLLDKFELINPIGEGTYGIVWKVYHSISDKHYAMKEMKKSQILSTSNLKGVLNEFLILSRLHHPFLANMHYAFQDDEKVFFILDFIPNSDLRYHIGEREKFTEKETKFLISCLLMGLQYIHYNGVTHGDIKPENLLLSDKGYLLLTDFGIARLDIHNNLYEATGTQGYISPEVLFSQQQNFIADYFAVGVIIYELMMGRRPVTSSNRRKLRKEMLANKFYISRSQIPEDWSEEAASLTNELLRIDPSERLGANGPKEIISHPWFTDID